MSIFKYGLYFMVVAALSLINPLLGGLAFLVLLFLAVKPFFARVTVVKHQRQEASPQRSEEAVKRVMLVPKLVGLFDGAEAYHCLGFNWLVKEDLPVAAVSGSGWMLVSVISLPGLTERSEAAMRELLPRLEVGYKYAYSSATGEALIALYKRASRDRDATASQVLNVANAVYASIADPEARLLKGREIPKAFERLITS